METLCFSKTVISRHRKIDLENIERETLIASRAVVKSGIPSQLCPGRLCSAVGELIFEKTHQVLNVSNNREIDYNCMRSAAFND